MSINNWSIYLFIFSTIIAGTTSFKCETIVSIFFSGTGIFIIVCKYNSAKTSVEEYFPSFSIVEVSFGVNNVESDR